MKKLDISIFYSNIDYMCEKKKISVADLGRHIGDSKATLYVGKTQKTIPNLTRVVAIADYFGVTLDDILYTDYTAIEDEIKRKESELENLRGKIERLKEDE